MKPQLRNVADHSRKIVRPCARLQNGPQFVHILPPRGRFLRRR